MIPIEKQVTSVEPSIRLQELGVEQDSAYYWTWAEWNEKTEWVLIPRDRAIKLKKQKFSAFTVAEHGIALPRSIRSYRDTNAKEEFWVCKLQYKKTEYADTEANARAQMRIWLIENKLVEME